MEKCKSRQLRELRLLLGFLALFGIGQNALLRAELARPPEQALPCMRTNLDLRPAWINSALWNESGKRLILPDLKLGGLRQLDRTGKARGEIKRPGRGELEFNRPVAINKLRSGFLLQNGSAHLLWLNDAFEPYQALRLDVKPSGRGETLSALRQSAVTPDGTIFVYGDILRPDNTWLTGLFRVRITPDPSYELLLQDDGASTKSKFYAMIYSYFATLGEVGYILVMDDQPYILEIDKDARQLEAFPERFRKAPILPPFKGFESVPMVMQAVERATFPVGLYGWRDRLYVLGREPLGKGETRWSLTRIDPVTDAIGSTLVLPTRSNHIVVAPGPESWAIVEKGPIGDGMKQTVESLLLVPSKWIEETPSPLAADGHGDHHEVICHES